MADNTEHINITLVYSDNRGKIVDLRIPSNITVYRFIRELNQIFGRNKALKKYQLKVLNKGILLSEEQRIKDYPITDGDIIEVLEEQVHGIV
ncbi:EsaB/YukD family protein [uncultured Enterococcus sp.]|uniref:EsaB/YukD family protein n=1 Tax=uncultured Enterococcus sp. TaxID=167972 RepID=UPI002AA90322|nr:EsaB/YukD family protein [uncultured Enterococcus sp.]